MKKSVLIILLFILLYNTSFAKDGFDFMQNTTPKDYFSSGNISYYFGYDGGYEFWFDKDNITFTKILNIENNDYGKPALSKFIKDAKEILYLPDGSIVLHNTREDFSCIDNANFNCLYSPVYIRKINKKSLTGKISLKRIDKNIPLQEDETIDFPLGSMLYSMVVEVPAYDFSTFVDYESLLCIKNEENLCKGVINNGELDKIALFELGRVVENNVELLYKSAGHNLIYKVDLIDNTLTPYNKSCALSSFSSSKMQSCKVESLSQGVIKQYRHPSGFIYYQFIFNNMATDNIVYWINNRGEPFKVYINNHLVYNFSIFNNMASKKMMDKLQK